MKTIVSAVQGCSKLVGMLAVIVQDGARPPVTDDDCVARMVSLGKGEECIHVLVLGRLSDSLTQEYPMEAGCPLDLDGLLEWSRRMLVYQDENEYVKRMFSNVLKKRLEGEDDLTLYDVWSEVFKGDIVKVGDDVSDDAKLLEVLYARLLTSEEQKQLKSMVPKEWMPVIKRSGISNTNTPVREQAGSWWQRNKMRLAICTGLAGLCYLFRLRAEHTASLAHEDTSAGWALLADVVSRSDLASLRTPPDVCDRAVTATAQKMQPVSAIDWQRVGWCNQLGGQLVCNGPHGQDPFCHAFGIPTKFDAAAVWKAVSHHFSPKECAIHCDSWEDFEELTRKRTAIELAPTILNMDVSHSDVTELTEMAQEILEQFFHSSYVTPILKDCHRTDCIVPDPDVSCALATRECTETDEEGHKQNVSTIADFNTSPIKMLNQPSALFSLPRYKNSSSECVVKCLGPTPEPKELKQTGLGPF